MRARYWVPGFLVCVMPLPASAGPCGHIEDPLVTVLNQGARIGTAAEQVPSGGGVILGLVHQGGSPLAGKSLEGWTFHDPNDKEYTLTPQVLAPGLVVYDFPPITGPVVLGPPRSPLARYDLATTKLPAILAAPSVRHIIATQRRVPAGSQPMTVLSVTAEVKKPPAGAVALVVIGKDGASRSWSRVSSEDTDFSYTVYQSAGRCESEIPGVAPSMAGEKVRLAWVDRFGRMSKQTSLVTVGRGK